MVKKQIFIGDGGSSFITADVVLDTLFYQAFFQNLLSCVNLKFILLMFLLVFESKTECIQLT
jgi:hypothetical protein